MDDSILLESGDASLSHPGVRLPRFRDAITVSAWIDAKEPGGEAMQALVSQWSPPREFGSFSAFDASCTDGLESIGYFGAVFDGHYVYFVPEMLPSLETHAVVLRYDTHGDFRDSRSYAAYDARNTGGIDVRGFYGAAFDGTYVYFVPRQFDRVEYHSRILRLDTRREFKEPAAWDVHDVGLKQSAQSAAFDGRYLYLAPGFFGDPSKENDYCSTVIRYDTSAPFHDASSYATSDMRRMLSPKAACFDGAEFDGRYIYFVPLYDHIAVRYDTHGRFDDPRSWQEMDLSPLGAGLFVGAVFDGRHLYYVPYACSVAVRFDTTADFTQRAAWEAVDVDHIDGLRTNGFDGGFFDGRYIHFVPFVYGTKESGYTFHTNLLRYDPTKPFAQRSSWEARDGMHTDGLRATGYNAGAFDGRFFYFAPWQQGRDPQTNLPRVHGGVLRYDTLGANGVFSLRYCDYGHNGGLNAAVMGPSFLINTTEGVRSVASHRILPPGRHHLAGTYDGTTISLFIDGELVVSRQACGAIQPSEAPLTVGCIDGGTSRFRGTIDRVAINAVAQSAQFIRDESRRGC